MGTQWVVDLLAIVLFSCCALISLAYFSLQSKVMSLTPLTVTLPSLNFQLLSDQVGLMAVFLSGLVRGTEMKILGGLSPECCASATHAVC